MPTRSASDHRAKGRLPPQLRTGRGGISKQYQTDKKFDRFKINGVLVFDLLPNITPGNILKDLGAGTRFSSALPSTETSEMDRTLCRRTSAPISIFVAFLARFEEVPCIRCAFV